jgi:hypothetical protein
MYKIKTSFYNKDVKFTFFIWNNSCCYIAHIFFRMMCVGMYINTKDRRKKTQKFANIIQKYLFHVNPKINERDMTLVTLKGN